MLLLSRRYRLTSPIIMGTRIGGKTSTPWLRSKLSRALINPIHPHLEQVVRVLAPSCKSLDHTSKPASDFP